MKLLLLICLNLILLMSSINASAQNDFETFWKTFKSAVAKSDKNAVASLTKFPVEMSYGIKPVRTKADFLKRYAEIFNGEANAAKCFAQVKPEKETAKRFVVYCGFKETPDDLVNTPIKYTFILTKMGWKFVDPDNINE